MHKITPLFSVLLLVFFSFSAQAFQADVEWLEVKPEGVAVKVQMPIEPKHQDRTMTLEDGTEIVVSQYMATVNEGRLMYMLSHNNYPGKVETPEDRNLAYENLIKGALFRVSGELTAHNEVMVQKVKGREFIYSFADRNENKFKIQSRAFIRDGQIFEIKIVSLDDSIDENEASRFFKSFRFTAQAN